MLFSAGANFEDKPLRANHIRPDYVIRGYRSAVTCENARSDGVLNKPRACNCCKSSSIRGCPTPREFSLHQAVHAFLISRMTDGIIQCFSRDVHNICLKMPPSPFIMPPPLIGGGIKRRFCAVREAATICPALCKLTFDLLTLKVVSESPVMCQFYSSYASLFSSDVCLYVCVSRISRVTREQRGLGRLKLAQR